MLECRDVRKSFGSLRALDGVSFKVRDGIIKGLIGPNGSGKTVLIQTISGVPYGPDSGQISFNGTRIERSKPREICRLGIARTFQSTTVFSSLTVEQNILIGALSMRSEGGAIDRAMKVSGLSEKKRARADQLSIVESKKLMLAMCLSMDPKLIMLDEPLAGLSNEEADEMLNIITDLNRSGLGILIVEHKIRELSEICDEVVVLHLGKVIAEGNPSEVLNDVAVSTAYFGIEHAAR